MKGSRQSHLSDSSLILVFNGFRIYNKKYQKYQNEQRKKRKPEITAGKNKKKKKKYIKDAERSKEEYRSKKILKNKYKELFV